ncbi:hypothetical protein [Chloroflexus sp. Y-396-1]|uniref:hypothetical protein n=1 Tax=Chloroflexus sp. Y-396-1 TaxID=867845 RepID=UPI0004B9363E|nr:hypothetical protein [Chloroflexus sp. Y-396-1]
MLLALVRGLLARILRWQWWNCPVAEARHLGGVGTCPYNAPTSIIGGQPGA